MAHVQNPHGMAGVELVLMESTGLQSDRIQPKVHLFQMVSNEVRIFV